MGGTAVRTSGWPCYEGVGRQSGYDGANLKSARTSTHRRGPSPRPTTPTTTPAAWYPTRAARREAPRWRDSSSSSPPVTPTRPSTTELVLRRLQPRLHLVHAEGCRRTPGPRLIRTFVAGAANPVNLETGPDGDLFYVDFDGGTIRRVTFTSANRPPVAARPPHPRPGLLPSPSPSMAAAPLTPTAATRSAMPGTWMATEPSTIRPRSSRHTPTPRQARSPRRCG